jgi:hypothetical protein
MGFSFTVVNTKPSSFCAVAPKAIKPASANEKNRFAIIVFVCIRLLINYLSRKDNDILRDNEISPPR